MKKEKINNLSYDGTKVYAERYTIALHGQIIGSGRPFPCGRCHGKARGIRPF